MTWFTRNKILKVSLNGDVKDVKGIVVKLKDIFAFEIVGLTREELCSRRGFDRYRASLTIYVNDNDFLGTIYIDFEYDVEHVTHKHELNGVTVTVYGFTPHPEVITELVKKLNLNVKSLEIEDLIE